MTRRQLAGAIVHTHEVAVTCVGILSYEGAEEHFNAVLQRSNELNRAWIDLFACDAYHVHDAQEHRLWYACREGYRQFEIVQQCVAHGWDPNFVDSANGENPLMIAIKTGHAVVAISLLKLGVVDVTARNFLGQTAFHLACEKGQAGTLAALLSSLNRDPSASAEDESNLQHLLAEKSFAGLTPLAYAVHGTHVECVETLLKWASTRDWIDRVGLNVKDSQGMTPVAKASALGAAQVLDLFLRHVVDPHHLSTPLIVAAKFGQESVIRLLLSRLDSLLQSSKVDGLSRPMSKKLLLEDQSRKLAILNAKGDDGKNALDWALLGDHDACARVLIEKGALASMDSATPADVASKE